MRKPQQQQQQRQRLPHQQQQIKQWKQQQQQRLPHQQLNDFQPHFWRHSVKKTKLAQINLRFRSSNRIPHRAANALFKCSTHWQRNKKQCYHGQGQARNGNSWHMVEAEGSWAIHKSMSLCRENSVAVKQSPWFLSFMLDWVITVKLQPVNRWIGLWHFLNLEHNTCTVWTRSEWAT